MRPTLKCLECKKILRAGDEKRIEHTLCNYCSVKEERKLAEMKLTKPPKEMEDILGDD